MSGDHNMYQKPHSYLDFECPRCGHCCKQARSLTDELMDCVDRLGSEADTVDPRVWQHLLVYAPQKQEPVAWIERVDTALMAELIEKALKEKNT